MTASLVATIPGGYWADGACWREALLREPSGEDHRALAQDARSLPLAEWATEALTRCTVRLGPSAPVTRDVLRSLSVGDRQALLLQLHRAIADDRLRCLVTCPRPECAQPLDLDLWVSDLLLPPNPDPRRRHEAVVGSGDFARLVQFRVPNGGDQEAVANLARLDLLAAVEVLLSRCLELVDGAAPPELPGSVVEQLSARMAELDPQAELTFEVTCAACGSSFNTPFDAASYLRTEIESAARMLHQQVHLLAYHYHWSPSEILGLGTRERQRYLELLADELSRQSGG